MQSLGAITAVAPVGDVRSAAHGLVDVLAQGPREAQRVIRGLVSQAYETLENTQLDAERDAMARAAGGAEAAEGIAAFLEKRTPRFQT